MGSALSDLDARWPAAVVPCDKKALTEKRIKDAVDQAIDFFRKYTAFVLVEHTTEKDFIKFEEDDEFDIAGSSSFGRKGGPQTIHINPKAKRKDGELVTSLLHEIGHALGMPHEQARPDRDDFVIFFEKNLKDAEDDEQSFEKRDASDVVLPTAYDYGSRMHYRPTGKAKRGTLTLDVNTKGGHARELLEVMGASKLMSKRDVATLNYIADPLPGGPLTRGTWKTIGDGHQLVPLGGDRIIDWEVDTGKFRIWHFDAGAKGHDNPLSHADLPGGSFPLVGDDHRLIAVDDGLLIDWHPATGAFRLWDLANPSIKSGRWETIGEDHHIVALGGRRVLVWDDDGNYRLWVFDPSHPKLLSGPQASGRWQTIDGDHELVLLGDGNILDQSDDEYRVFAVNRGAEGSDNPLSHTLAAGRWDTIDDDHVLVPIGEDRVIDWEPDSGAFRVWRYASKFDAYPPDPRKKTSCHGQHPSLGGAHALEIDDGYLLTWDDAGAYRLWRINYGVVSGDALELLRKDHFGHDMVGHQLVALPGKRVLDFDAAHHATGTVYEVQLDKAPLWKRTITTHRFTKIDGTHRLIRLSSHRVLDWVPASIPDASSFSVREYDASASGTDNPFPGSPKSSGQWSTTEGQMIGAFHALVPLDSGRVLDWVPRANFFRIWDLAIHSTDESILRLPTLAEGFWDDLAPTTQIIALAGARILEWDAEGNYRISSIAVVPAIPFP